MPPRPMPAMFSLSLGATFPCPPSTCRGKMVKAASAVPTPGTKSRREMPSSSHFDGTWLPPGSRLFGSHFCGSFVSIALFLSCSSSKRSANPLFPCPILPAPKTCNTAVSSNRLDAGISGQAGRLPCPTSSACLRA